MKAVITKKDGFKCAPTGAIVEDFAFGCEVTGQVAEWAVDAGAAKVLGKKKPSKKVTKVVVGNKKHG